MRHPTLKLPTDANGDNVYVVTVQASDGNGRHDHADDQRHGHAGQRQQSGVHVDQHGQRGGEHDGREDRDGHRCGPAGADGDVLDRRRSRSGASSGSPAAVCSRSIRRPNFEAPTDANGDNVYVVTVQASDGNGGTTTQTINVTVTPVNDNSPVFTSPDTASVPENTTAVMTVTATDADLPAQTVTFSIVGGADQSKFSITSGGVLSFITPPDFAVPTDANGDNVYVVTVAGQRWQWRHDNTDDQRHGDVGSPTTATHRIRPRGPGPETTTRCSTDNGPRHTIVAGLRMGANVDARRRHAAERGGQCGRCERRPAGRRRRTHESGGRPGADGRRASRRSTCG